MTKSIFFSLFLALMVWQSCNSFDKTSLSYEYAFFVAGHVYGSPIDYQYGVHPPFKNDFEYIRNTKDLQLGVFTGDIVPFATAAYWDSIDADIVNLGLPVHFAVGNHDMIDRGLYESRYDSTYYSFVHENDLFICLDPNIDHWNISGNQLDFLKQTLITHSPTVRHIFVFTHQLLWWEEHNRFKDFGPNSPQGRADTINFWTEIEPLFHELSNEVVLFAGDCGAVPKSSGVSYDHYDNITIVGSGMGNKKMDNYVIVEVGDSIAFRLIALGEKGRDALGVLEDYNVRD